MVALADGAGSARCSEVGAAVVSQEVCNFVADNFSVLFATQDTSAIAKQILDALLQKLSITATEVPCNLHDLASTLLFVALHEGQYLIGHLGDGVIEQLTGEGLDVVSILDNSEYANETYFITSPHAAQHLRITKGTLDADVQGFVLMSDGPEMSFYQKQQQKLAPVLSRLMKYLIVYPAEDLQKSIQEDMETLIKKAHAG